MKRIIAVMLSLCLCAACAACALQSDGSSSSQSNQSIASQAPASTQTPEQPLTEDSEATSSEGLEAQSSEESGEATGSNILVAYFTYGENAPLPDDVDASASASIQIWDNEIIGNTGVVAHMIQEASGADIFSIRTVESYPASYDETVDQGEEENNANARPELSTHIENLDDYDVIFLGFPNWWYDMPMPIYSFLEEYDFSGKTIIPFVTSGGSGFSSAISTIEEMESGATVIEGISIGARSATGAQADVEAWLTDLGYLSE